MLLRKTLLDLTITETDKNTKVAAIMNSNTIPPFGAKAHY